MRLKLLALLLVGILLLTSCGYVVVDDDSETVLGAVFGQAALGEAAYTDIDIQTRLIELGFLGGKADGIFGPRSVAALKAFQTLCGLEATGKADDMTINMLFGDPAALPTPAPTPLAPGAKDTETSMDVREIQERLTQLNYFHSTIDGIYGPATQEAIKQFQSLNGLEVTGIADDTTRAAMNDVIAVPMPTPEPTPRVKGAKGEDIVNVQKALRIMGFMSGDSDGDYGNETERSIMRYQQYVHDREEEFYAANPTPTPTPEPTPTPAPTAAITMFDESGQPIIQDDVIDEKLPEESQQPEQVVYKPDGVLSDELMADILAFNNVTLYRQEVKKGDNNGEVERLQRRLASLWYLDPVRDCDGQFGQRTEEALKYFQKRNHLEEHGIADRGVQALLFSAEAVVSDKPVNLYKLKISVSDQKVYAYKWVNGDYTELVRTMVCSTGLKDTPTPLGTFSSGGPCGTWYYFKKFDCWARYAFRINGGILFHSVIYSQKDESTLRKSTVNALGRRASHGCVRLSVEDAKWIYNNCNVGTTVVVY